MSRVVIVHLGRAAAMGGNVRVRGLKTVFEAAGADVEEVRLLADAPAGPHILRADVRAVINGSAVPETLAWSPAEARRLIGRHRPDLVICSTARSFHPSFIEQWPVVLDFIDRLSDSYRDRTRIATGPKRAAFGALSRRMLEFETRSADLDVIRLAAGWADAAALDAEWVPIHIDIPVGSPAHQARPEFDAVFFGNLSYEPNIAAVRRLADIWPLVTAERPEARLLIAGARPGPAIHRLAHAGGWTVMPNFNDVADVLSSAQLAIAPLDHASGVQTKVLEAAGHGVAQIVSPAARAGLDPRFPIRVADGDHAFAQAIVTLLRSPQEREDLARQARMHLLESYSVERWVPWAAGLLDVLVMS